MQLSWHSLCYFCGMGKFAVLLFVMLSMGFGSAHAQTMVFGTDGHYFNQPVLRLDQGRTMPPYSYNVMDAGYTAVGNRIMEGASSSEFDLLYTFREGKIYTGTAMYSSQIRYTYQDGRIYKGDSVFQLDILYNYHDNVIYHGANSFPSDALYYVEGQISITQLFAILLGLGLIA